MSDDDGFVPDESVRLDQLQPDDSLVDRGVDDVLDEGFTTPERWSPAQGFGSTAAEMRRGETLEQRVAQEEVAPVRLEGPWNPEDEPREVGRKRAGRLVDGRDGGGRRAANVGFDVGIDGGAASAEEAAMHIIDEYDDEDDEDD